MRAAHESVVHAWWRHALPALLLAGALASEAAVFRDVRYADADSGGGGTAVLDVHQPGRPGPHPVVLAVGSDATPGLAARLAARGYLVAEVRMGDGAAARRPRLAEVRAALHWLRGHASAYDGDRDRIAVLALGAGVPAVATLAADATLGDDAPIGVMLVPGAVVIAPAAAVGAATTAALIIVDDASRPAARAAERYAGQRRKRGAAVDWLVVPHAEDGAEALVETAGAWIATRALPRVQRVENLGFEADDGFAAAVGARAGSGGVGVLQAHAHRLYAALEPSDAARPAQIWQLAAADAVWRRDADFGPAFQRVAALLETRTDADPPTPRLVAVLQGQRGTGVALRDPASASWSRPLALAPEASAASAVHGVAHHDAVLGAPLLLLAVADGGSGPRALRARADPSQPVVLGAVEPGIEGVVTGLAVANGVAYAALAPRADGAGGGLYRRVDGPGPRWERAAAWPTPNVGPPRTLRALSAVPDPGGGGHQVLLGMLDGGMIVRLDPHAGHAGTVELDALAALSSAWGSIDDAVPVRATTPRFEPVLHPESNDLVHALGIAVRHPAGPGAAYYLVRQADASYSVASAHDLGPAAPGTAPGSIRAIATTPFVVEGGRALYLAGANAAGDLPWLARARWAPAAFHRGLWWDRAANGVGLELRRAGERWVVLLYCYDDRGDPTWYFALGDLADGRFVADAGGLARYTAADDRSPPQRRDAEGSGRIELRFDAAPDAAPCAAQERTSAPALAALTVEVRGRSTSWCLEPFVQRAGVPSTGVNGLWFGGEDDQGWGLGIDAQGYDGATRVTATLFYHDGAGEPRWAVAIGELGGGEADLDLLSLRGPCVDCRGDPMQARVVGTLALRFTGGCGEARGSARISVSYPGDEGGSFRRLDVPLEPLATAACY